MKFVKNKAGRMVPAYVDGTGPLKPFNGEFNVYIQGRQSLGIRSSELLSTEMEQSLT